jgi:uroporphyrinogen decarboxylase
MNKRDAMLSLLDETTVSSYVTAAFFLHFGPPYLTGRAAVDKHLEYFKYTGMDFVKIQYEKSFPQRPEISKPEDWSKMPLYGRDFYDEQLQVVEGLVKAAKKDALVIITLYSPFMCAGHTTSQPIITDHLNRDPEAVRRGLEIITDSLMIFVRACIELGVDGFYHSTQGGEAGHFQRKDTFERYIKPYDLRLMEEINQRCLFNILHICDYVLPYDDFSQFLDYPGNVINSPLNLGEKILTPSEVAQMFKRPYMGGLERKGELSTGKPEQIPELVETVLRAAPDRFILGADCTVPSDTPWDNLKAAIDTAHAYSRS